MRAYITIDGGTTSTRVRILENRQIIDSVKLDMGVLAASENREMYVSALKDAVDKLLKENGSCKVEKILASGMITSEFGLCNLPHIKTPAGIGELHDSMHETLIPEISDIPFVFIRGVKTDCDDAVGFDMMRGEETELIGILNSRYGECIYVLPGSHSKIIKTDERGRITNFSTMLTGEMIAALSKGTILKDAVDLSVSEVNREYLLKGYKCAKAEGINKALFKVRILKNIFGCSKDEVYSFFMGVILCDEISSITKDESKNVVIGGRAQIKSAMALILKEETDKNVIELSEKTVDYSTSIGMIKVYEKGDK